MFQLREIRRLVRWHAVVESVFGSVWMHEKPHRGQETLHVLENVPVNVLEVTLSQRNSLAYGRDAFVINCVAERDQVSRAVSRFSPWSTVSDYMQDHLTG
jgi:hypothetical protein